MRRPDGHSGDLQDGVGAREEFMSSLGGNSGSFPIPPLPTASLPGPSHSPGQPAGSRMEDSETRFWPELQAPGRSSPTDNSASERSVKASGSCGASSLASANKARRPRRSSAEDVW